MAYAATSGKKNITFNNSLPAEWFRKTTHSPPIKQINLEFRDTQFGSLKIPPKQTAVGRLKKKRSVETAHNWTPLTP